MADNRPNELDEVEHHAREKEWLSKKPTVFRGQIKRRAY